jgi:hypothetical protein
LDRRVGHGIDNAGAGRSAPRISFGWNCLFRNLHRMQNARFLTNGHRRVPYFLVLFGGSRLRPFVAKRRKPPPAGITI